MTTLPVPLNVIEPPAFTVAKNDRVASTVVPGMSKANDRYCRELMGSVSICCRVTTPDTSAFVVSTTGDSALTVTVSATAWIFTVKSRLSSRPMVMKTPRTSYVAKPDNSARSR